MRALIFFSFMFLVLFSGHSVWSSKPSVFKLKENQQPVLILETKNETSLLGQRELNNQDGSLTQGQPAMLPLQGQPGYPNQQGRPEVFNQPGWILQGKSGESKRSPDASEKQEESGLYGHQGTAGSSRQLGKPASSIHQETLGSSSQQGQLESSGQAGDLGTSRQQGKPGSPSQQGKPGSSNQQGKPGSPSQQGKPGSPSQQGKPGSSNQQGKPGSPSQQGKPGSPSQQGKPGSPSQPGKPAPLNQQGKPGSTSQKRNSISFYKQGERKNVDNSLKSNIMKTQTNNTSSKIPLRNTQCESVYQPVCGSDGKTYGNLCIFKEAKSGFPWEFNYEISIDIIQLMDST